MPIDRTLPPTNKLLLECGPDGTRFAGDEELYIPVLDDECDYLDLELQFIPSGECCATLHIELTADSLTRRMAVCKLPLGHVTTIGEVIDLYERLSQKRWPGSGE